MSYWGRLRRTWLWSRAATVWLVLGLLPLVFAQTAIHEGSHCVMMEVTGLGCSVMAPFTVSMSFGSPYGVTLPEVEPEGALPISTIVAPQVVAALLIVGLRLTMRVPRSESVTVLTRLWLLGACVDLLNNTFWRPRGVTGDWSVLANTLGLTSGTVLAMSMVAWGLIAWGLLAPLPEPRPPLAARARDLWPIGVACALMSAAASYVSLSVQVPDSDATTLWHRVPILLQAGSVVVCLAVVASARLTRREAT